MNSDAMIGAGIYSGDVLIVDRSIKPVNGKIIVAILNGELLIRRLHTQLRGITLLAENKRYGDIQVDEFAEYKPWGVVTYTIHTP
jgi:DNA polymerase V